MIYSWETLARGRTGDRLWDVARRSLLIHGELHNNVRMTWGKARLNWTSDAQSALAMMIDLNHRYALDGQDPASFGGILWCLGQFDRPFPPARPILGIVRDRSTAELLTSVAGFAAGRRGQYERLVGPPCFVRPVTGTALRRWLRSRIGAVVDGT